MYTCVGVNLGRGGLVQYPPPDRNQQKNGMVLIILGKKIICLGAGRGLIEEIYKDRKILVSGLINIQLMQENGLS